MIVGGEGVGSGEVDHHIILPGHAILLRAPQLEIECDVVIMALGTSPNPLIASTTEALEVTRRGCIVADEWGQTSRKGVFAGGDTVTGAATVILAMGAGRKAAEAIDRYIKGENESDN